MPMHRYLFILVSALLLLLVLSSVGWFALTCWIVMLGLHVGYVGHRRLLNKYWLAFSFSILLLFIPRLYGMPMIDSIMFHGDEAIISKNALDMFIATLSDNKWHFSDQTIGTVAFFPALWYYIQGSIIYLAGPSVWSTKLFALITDFGIAVLIGIFATQWQGKKFGFAGAIVYATLPAGIHFGMTGYQNIQSTFFMMLTIVALQHALAKGHTVETNAQRSSLYLAGLSAGVGMYFYLSSYLTPLIAIIAIVIMGSSIRQTLLRITIFCAGFVIAGLPYFVSTVKSGLLFGGRENVFTLKEAIPNAIITVQGFWAYPFNGSGAHYIDQPLLVHWIIFALFMLGGSIITTKAFRRKPSAILLTTTLIMTLLFGTILTETPIASQRILHILPPTALLITLGVKALDDLIRKYICTSKYTFWMLTLLVCVLQLQAYIHDNLPAYKSLPREELAITQYLINHNELAKTPVLYHMPVHKAPLIYFYSNGNILPTKSTFTSGIMEPSPFVYISVPEGLTKLPDGYTPALLDYTYNSAEQIRLYYVTTDQR